MGEGQKRQGIWERGEKRREERQEKGYRREEGRGEKKEW